MLFFYFYPVFPKIQQIRWRWTWWRGLRAKKQQWCDYILIQTQRKWILCFSSFLLSTVLRSSPPSSLPLILSLFLPGYSQSLHNKSSTKVHGGITLHASSLFPLLLNLSPQWRFHLTDISTFFVRRTEYLHRNSYKWISNEMFVTAHLGLCSSLTLLDSHHLLTFSSWRVAVAPFCQRHFSNKGRGIWSDKRENSRVGRVQRCRCLPRLWCDFKSNCGKQTLPRAWGVFSWQKVVPVLMKPRETFFTVQSAILLCSAIKCKTVLQYT